MDVVTLSMARQLIEEAKSVVFDIRDYGAVGDGITDDHDAIENAMLAAREYVGGVGGAEAQATILFPPPPKGPNYFVGSPLGAADLDISCLAFVGIGGYKFRAPTLKAGFSSGSILTGKLHYGAVKNLRFDLGGLGALGPQLWIDHTALDAVEFVRWTASALNLNDSSIFGDAAGYLTLLNELEFGDGPDPDPEGDGLPEGFPLVWNYGLTDSYARGCYFGRGWANVLLNGGGPYRFEDCHFDGTAVVNVLGKDSPSSIAFSDCIMEHSTRQAVMFQQARWITDPSALRFQAVGGFWRGASQDGGEAGNWPVIDLAAISPTTPFQDFSLSAVSFGRDELARARRVLDAAHLDSVAILGNTWSTQYSADDPVFIVGGTNVEVLGNGGRNTVATLPASPEDVVGFTPALWLRADHVAGADAAPVTAWADESGNAFTPTVHGTPTKVAAGPNGHVAIAFDGTSAYLSVDDAAALKPYHFAIHAVVNPANLAARMPIAKKGFGYEFTLMNDESAGKIAWNTHNGRGDQYLGDSDMVAASTWQVLSVFYDGYVLEIRVNGVVLNRWTQNYVRGWIEHTTDGLQLFGDGTSFFHGQIAELIITAGPEGIAQRVAIDLALMSKYGIE